MGPFTPDADSWHMVATLLAIFSAFTTEMEPERTFLMIKPDGVQRGLVPEIMSRFQKKGYKLVALKMVKPKQKLAADHYAEHHGKTFYPGLLEFIMSGPCVAMVWEGLEVVSYARTMIGATNPLASQPGTIRGDFGIHVGRNIIHGSDGVEAAKKEIGLWFEPEEVVSWDSALNKWIYE